MARARPGRPHLPYTTLFRSDPDHDRAPPSRAGRREHVEIEAVLGGAGDPERGGRLRAVRRELAGVPDPGPARGDRKSTRLNSSHRCISYAVFSLKKKRSTIY